MTPVRVQRRREKGWRMPENTVYVGRPSKWGNPWPLSVYSREFGYYFGDDTPKLRKYALAEYRSWLSGSLVDRIPRLRDALPPRPDLAPLRDKNLACWCPLDQPCHADVLLELANR